MGDKNLDVRAIFNIVASIVIWGLAVTIGLTVFTTLAGIVLAFASTGIGAIILAIVAWRWYVKHKKEQE